MEARRTRKPAWSTAVGAVPAAIVFALLAGLAPAGGAGGKRGLARAEATARQAVLAHPSYRRIGSTRTGLRTRHCRRVPASRVRCSLYVVVANPCALARDDGAVCAQALWERRWLVQVSRSRGRAPAARIVKISSGPAGRAAD